MNIKIFVIQIIVFFIFSVNLCGHNLLTLQEVVTGFNEPVQVTNAGDGSNRLFVVEKRGRIMILKDNVIREIPFLDISSKVFVEFELGLLSIAFHPDFKNNGRFFVSYTTKPETNFKTIIGEYAVSSDDPNIALNEESIILMIDEHTSVHHGGQLQFGPDGFLYISIGDGGFGGDEAQDINSFFGSVLRIDVDTETPFSVPGDNPFVNKDGADEIWAYGFRNPWRFSFDRLTGRLFLGDVGQSCSEEINLVEKASNYGWNILEAKRCFSHPTQFDCFEDLVDCDDTGFVPPINDYPRSEGRTVIGGYVYRGSQMTDLFGKYIFGDFGSTKIWSLEEMSLGIWIRTELLNSGLQISSFGEDENGEIYVSDHTSGTVYRLEESVDHATPSPSPTLTPTPTPPVKKFVVNCETDIKKGMAGVEKLILELGNDETCILKLVNLASNIPVEISTNIIQGSRSSIKVEPITGTTDENGELEFKITALKKGIDWIMWAVKNQNGQFEFNRKAFNSGSAFGVFVYVK